MKHRAEEGRVAVRNVRRQRPPRPRGISRRTARSRKDDLDRAEKDLEKLTHEVVAEIDELLGAQGEGAASRSEPTPSRSPSHVGAATSHAGRERARRPGWPGLACDATPEDARARDSRTTSEAPPAEGVRILGPRKPGRGRRGPTARAEARRRRTAPPRRARRPSPRPGPLLPTGSAGDDPDRRAAAAPAAEPATGRPSGAMPLPHWTEPPTGEVPHDRRRRDRRRLRPGPRSSARARGSAPRGDWADADFAAGRALHDETTAVGALVDAPRGRRRRGRSRARSRRRRRTPSAARRARTPRRTAAAAAAAGAATPTDAGATDARRRRHRRRRTSRRRPATTSPPRVITGARLAAVALRLRSSPAVPAPRCSSP